MYDSFRLLRPWQMVQSLSDRVRLNFDLLNQHDQLLPCPVGWDILKRNAQVLIYDPEVHVIGIDSAYYEMLAELHGPASLSTELFLRAVAGRSAGRILHNLVERGKLVPRPALGVVLGGLYREITQTLFWGSRP